MENRAFLRAKGHREIRALLLVSTLYVRLHHCLEGEVWAGRGAASNFFAQQRIFFRCIRNLILIGGMHFAERSIFTYLGIFL